MGNFRYAQQLLESAIAQGNLSLPEKKNYNADLKGISGISREWERPEPGVVYFPVSRPGTDYGAIIGIRCRRSKNPGGNNILKNRFSLFTDLLGEFLDDFLTEKKYAGVVFDWRMEELTFDFEKPDLAGEEFDNLSSGLEGNSFTLALLISAVSFLTGIKVKANTIFTGDVQRENGLMLLTVNHLEVKRKTVANEVPGGILVIPDQTYSAVNVSKEESFRAAAEKFLFAPGAIKDFDFRDIPYTRVKYTTVKIIKLNHDEMQPEDEALKIEFSDWIHRWEYNNKLIGFLRIISKEIRDPRGAVISNLKVNYLGAMLMGMKEFYNLVPRFLALWAGQANETGADGAECYEAVIIRTNKNGTPGFNPGDKIVFYEG